MTNSVSAGEIVAVIRGVLRGANEPVTLHEPEFSKDECDALMECLTTGWVSTAGPHIERFEAALAEYVDCRHAVAVVNGTAALHLALLLADVRRNDEVLVPSLTFVATANAVLYCGATPHFVDVMPDRLSVDPSRLDEYLSGVIERRGGESFNRLTGRRIRALMIVHLLGHPAELDSLSDVCARYGLILVEDAAEALGSLYRNRHVGVRGLAGALSFNGNKIITSGGGGALVTNNEAVAKRARHLATTARLPHAWKYVHDEMGFNYRMPNINAALGYAQFKKLPDFLARKRVLANRYLSAFHGKPGISAIVEPEDSSSNHWLNAIALDADAQLTLDELVSLAEKQGIALRPLWTPLHLLEHLAECPSMNLDVTENLHRRVVCLPSSARWGAAL